VWVVKILTASPLEESKRPSGRPRITCFYVYQQVDSLIDVSQQMWLVCVVGTVVIE